MKLDGRRFEELLRDPARMRLVLLHGEDVGLVRDRGSRLTRAVAGSLDDPFRVVELERDAAIRIGGEMASLPLNGGRRVVRVRDAGDSLSDAVQAALASSGPGFLVLEAPGLPSRAKLRALLERAPDAASVACHPPGPEEVSAEIAAVLRSRAVTINADAQLWLESRLGNDVAMTRSEVEKLALYVGPGGQIDLASAQACVGDLAGLSLDDALFAATAGDMAITDRSLELALSEGASPVSVLRAALLHLQRLHRARIMVSAGASVGDAARAVRPPVFFRRDPVFQRALRLWSEAMLEAAAIQLWEADRGCKRTGAPADGICRSVVLELPRRATANLRF